jgi:hypothetical protein
MIYLRLGAAGTPKRTVLWLLLEIWVSFAFAGVVLASVSGLLGPSQAANAEQEALDFAARLGRLSGKSLTLFVTALGISVVLFARAIFSLRRAMRDYRL